jgi:hypothetical protein
MAFLFGDLWKRRFVKGQQQSSGDMVITLLTFKDGHLWIKDIACVGMYWREGIVAERR